MAKLPPTFPCKPIHSFLPNHFSIHMNQNWSPWRWRQYVPPKRRNTYYMAQKTNCFTIDVKPSKHTIYRTHPQHFLSYCGRNSASRIIAPYSFSQILSYLTLLFFLSVFWWLPNGTFVLANPWRDVRNLSLLGGCVDLLAVIKFGLRTKRKDSSKFKRK
jgi:hypothetical protein